MTVSNTANSAIFSKATTSVKASTGGGVIKKAIATDTAASEEKDGSLEGLTAENTNPEKASSEAGQNSTTKSGTAVASASKSSTLASTIPGLSAGSHIANQTTNGIVTNPSAAAGSNAANQTTTGTVTNPGNAAGSHLGDLSGSGVVSIPGIGAGSHLGNQNGNGTITPPTNTAPAPGTDTPGTITPPTSQAPAPGTSTPGTITPPTTQAPAPTSPTQGTITSSPYASNGLGLGGLGAFGSMGLGSFGGLGGFGGMGAQNRNNANQALGGGGGGSAPNSLKGNEQTPKTETPQKPEAKAKDDDKKTEEKKTEDTTEDDFVAKEKAGTFPDFIKTLQDTKTKEANLENLNTNLSKLGNHELADKISKFSKRVSELEIDEKKGYPKDLKNTYEEINKKLSDDYTYINDNKQSQSLKLENLFKVQNISEIPDPVEAPKEKTETPEPVEDGTPFALPPSASLLDNDFEISSLA